MTPLLDGGLGYLRMPVGPGRHFHQGNIANRKYVFVPLYLVEGVDEVSAPLLRAGAAP